MKTRNMKTGTFSLVVFTLVLTCAGMLLAAEPSNMILVGTITAITGNTITISALNNPTAVRTFTIATDTQIREHRVIIDRSLLHVGSVIVVHQVQSGTVPKAQSIENLGQNARAK